MVKGEQLCNLLFRVTLYDLCFSALVKRTDSLEHFQRYNSRRHGRKALGKGYSFLPLHQLLDY